MRSVQKVMQLNLILQLNPEFVLLIVLPVYY